MKYLAPYIFRVAISNRRILNAEEGQITFTYKDGDSGKPKHSALLAEEFIRRFLQHVLPKGFVKVRYYGLFSPDNRQRLQQVRQQLGIPLPLSPDQTAQEPAVPPVLYCLKCGQTMHQVQTLRPRSRCPP